MDFELWTIDSSKSSNLQTTAGGSNDEQAELQLKELEAEDLWPVLNEEDKKREKQMGDNKEFEVKAQTRKQGGNGTIQQMATESWSGQKNKKIKNVRNGTLEPFIVGKYTVVPWMVWETVFFVNGFVIINRYKSVVLWMCWKVSGEKLLKEILRSIPTFFVGKLDFQVQTWTLDPFNFYFRWIPSSKRSRFTSKFGSGQLKILRLKQSAHVKQALRIVFHDDSAWCLTQELKTTWAKHRQITLFKHI